MYGRQGSPSEPQQPPPWLVRAEVTIRHGAPVTSESSQAPVGSTSNATDTGGVRMIYRWNTSQPPSSVIPSSSTSSLASASASAPASASTSASSSMSAAPSSSSYGFQRGNILFTSTPPSRPLQGGSFTFPRSGSSGNDDSASSTVRGGSGSRVPDSGYSSEHFSPYTYSSLPTRRPSLQQYNRRCKSTCSIVLSASGADGNAPAIDNRRQYFDRSSHSTQTNDEAKFSGDIWHRHRQQQPHQHVSARSHFSVVPEVCEDCAEGTTSSAFTTHFCTRVPEKTANKSVAISKDASSQTTDIESRDSMASVTSKSGKPRRKQVATAAGATTPQLVEQKKIKQEIESPTPSVGTTSTTAQSIETDKSDSSAKDDSAKRKSRTVHIDVYCTGSDDDGNSDSSSDDERGTPMTVYENEDVRVIHTQAPSNNLPRGFQDEKAFLSRTAERRCESFRNAPMRMPSLASSKGYESDDVLSSLYPSQFSSYSALRDLDSVPWSAASSSTAIPLDDYDSAAATSSKDTASDIESLFNSSRTGLTPCDSFEYANSADRERIRRMEAIWARAEKEDKGKSWRSSQIERKQLLRNRKMREYLEKHDIGWSSGDSAADSDESGAVGWSFVSSEESTRVERKDSAIRSTSKNTVEPVENPSINVNRPETKSNVVQEDHSDSTNRNDCIPHPYTFRGQIGPFGSKSPSPLPSKVPSRVTSPFTTPQGEKTDHIVKASIFGRVISAFRKPGHHIGPSKNPSCSCEHCRRYFEENFSRGRSRSLGEFERRPGNQFHIEKGIIRLAPTAPRH